MRPPKLYTDSDLRSLPENPQQLKKYISHLRGKIGSSNVSTEQVSLMGELAVYLRISGDCTNAEKLLLQALEIEKAEDLGLEQLVQQEIRLAHVYQDMCNFEKSNELFTKVTSLCERDDRLQYFLDFALQHSGKNLFAQGRFDEALVLFRRALVLRKERGAPADQIDSTTVAIDKTLEAL